MALTANPLAEAAATVTDLIEATPAPKRRGTLLIVDDEDGPRQSLRVIFKDEYDLLMAADGPTAIQLAHAHEIDVAVLDIRMAGMSGIDVLEQLKRVCPAAGPSGASRLPISPLYSSQVSTTSPTIQPVTIVEA